MGKTVLPEFLHHRLGSQILSAGAFSPAEVVSHMGAMQAQDYQSALWAVGVRSAVGTKRSEIEKALADRAIVRTWPMRGTIHFVAARDVRWMLDLLTPRVLAAMSKRAPALGLDASAFNTCRRAFQKALKGGRILTREEMYEVMERAGVTAGSQRGYHVLCRLAQEKLICFGPQQGSRQTFVLLDEWCPESEAFTPDSPLGELALRYFTSHGPATEKDMAWWSGLTMKDVRQGIAEATGQLVKKEWDGETYWMSPSVGANEAAELLLPGFDEYLLGYTCRDHVLDRVHASKIVPGNNGVFRPMLLHKGRIVGTWQVTKQKVPQVVCDIFDKTASHSFAKGIKRYSDFLGVPLTGVGATAATAKR